VRLLITGAHGQLGSELVRHGGGHTLLAVDHDHLDICDSQAVSALCDAFHPEAIINAAAYTAVDRAESDSTRAFAVNRDGPKNLAVVAEAAGIPLIHISTDYVFDGSKQGAYDEHDPVAPLGVYGESKLAGEQAVQQHCSRHVILRTSWVFSAHGNNFVKTMLKLGADREQLAVVADQAGCPTAASELARAIYAVLETEMVAASWGIYHCCQPDPTTWFGFAKAVFDTASDQGMYLRLNNLNAITTRDYPTPAKRPANSVMDCSKFEEAFSFQIRSWQDSLEEVVRALHAQKN